MSTEENIVEEDSTETTDARSWLPGSKKIKDRMSTTGLLMPTSKDSDFYNMNHKYRGKAIIFNHYKFSPEINLPTRSGTNVDRDNLRVVLRQLEFDVEIHNDLRAQDIDRVLMKASLEDHTESDCIFIAVLSHGDNGVIYAYDRLYSSELIWTLFTADKCPTLAGKPKIIMFQACQGQSFDSGRKVVHRVQTDSISVSYKIPCYADFLLGYSTIPGHYSWRNKVTGSWFIQALCRVLEKEASSKDFLALLTRVNRMVAFDFESYNPEDPELHGMKQIPCFNSMFTRDLFFSRK